jgi:hypothetical protein
MQVEIIVTLLGVRESVSGITLLVGRCSEDAVLQQLWSQSHMHAILRHSGRILADSEFWPCRHGASHRSYSEALNQFTLDFLPVKDVFIQWLTIGSSGLNSLVLYCKNFWHWRLALALVTEPLALANRPNDSVKTLAVIHN